DRHRPMTAAILLGLLSGAGLALLTSGLVPQRPALVAALAQLHSRRPAPHDEPGPASLLVRVIGRPLARPTLAGRVVADLGRDLRVTGRTVDDLLTKQALCGIAGLLWAPATVGLMALGGVSVSFALPLWCSALLGFAGSLVPLCSVKVSAAERRR